MTPSPYRPISRVNTVNPIGFNNSTDARKATANQRQLVQGQGDALMRTNEELGNEYRDQSQGVEDYLHPIYDPMAQGQGGYNATEAAQIGFSPQDQQSLVTSAGINAGTRRASDIAAAERATAAAGGNPLALMTYRDRATRAGAGEAADAMTQARTQAKMLQSQGAQTIGNARLGQQGQALNYYGQLQGQKNANAQNEQALQQGAFGTTTAGTGAATGDVLKASQTPSTLDKIIGGAAGIATGLATKLADGDAGYLSDGGVDAVVGEDGPEAIIERGAGQKFMADGLGSGEAPEFNQMQNGSPEYSNQGSGEGQTAPMGAMGRFLASMRQKQDQQSLPQAQPKEPWNPVTPWQQAGEAAGQIGGALANTFKAAPVMAADGKAGDPMGIRKPQPRMAEQYTDRLERSVRKVPMARLESSVEKKRMIAPESRGAVPSTVYPDLLNEPEINEPEIEVERRVERVPLPHPGNQTVEPVPLAAPPPAHSVRMADGRMGTPRPAHPYGAPRIGRADMNAPSFGPKIITSPTHVRLAPGDQVVPLTHRPNAKVRPSAFVNAYRSAGRG